MSGTVPIPAITKLTAVRKHTKLVRYPNLSFCGAVCVALGAVLAVISAGLMTGSMIIQLGYREMLAIYIKNPKALPPWGVVV